MNKLIILRAFTNPFKNHSPYHEEKKFLLVSGIVLREIQL